MAKFSDYFENVIINHLFRNQPFTPPATLYLGLYTVAPTDEGGGTEVSGGGYARQPFTLTAPTTAGVTENADTITFPTATADWGTIVAVGIFDAETGGNLLMWGNLTTSKTVSTGDTFQFNAGDLDITID